MPTPHYSECSRNGLTFTQTTGTTTTATNDPHLTYFHPSTSAFARPSNSQIQPQTQSAPLSPPASSINTIDLGTQSPTAESNIRSHTEDIEAQSAARILMNIHSAAAADNSLSQNRLDVDLLDVGGSGRSGLRSRGVTIRRQGAIPVDERLSTEEVVAGEGVREGSESSLTSLEELEGGKWEEEEEDGAASRKVQPGGGKKGKGKEKQKPKKATKKEKKEKKTSSGAAKDYQRHSVRDGKGRFIKK